MTKSAGAATQGAFYGIKLKRKTKRTSLGAITRHYLFLAGVSVTKVCACRATWNHLRQILEAFVMKY